MTAGRWIEVGAVEDIPRRGARVVTTGRGDIAVVRTADDRVFALDDRCPHKGGPLSQGIVHGHSVTCPLHNWVIGLDDGNAKGADSGCAHAIPVRLAKGKILLRLSVAAEAAA
jgi:nitrite reductase (NADH) small subunit